VIPANDIFIGINAIDYSGYPDCRPEFIEAFENLADVGTKAGVEGDSCLLRLKGFREAGLKDPIRYAQK
jgi:7-cyano-7-deazaguanine synthase